MSDSANQLIEAGYQARREGQPANAKRLFSEALARCRKGDGTTDELARSLCGLGQIERDLGNSAAGLARYQEAVAVFRGLGEPLRLAHTIRHMGDILRHRRAVEEARACYEEALGIYRQHAETPNLDLANAVRGFALLREEAGESEQAKSLWREARGLYETANVPQGVKESEAHIARGC
jgi:tetratricopeptide (TPR) repeat protein